MNLEISSGKVPLLMTAKCQSKGIVKFLIELGVNVDCRDEEGYTVLHYAARYKWPDVVQSVVEKGCDVNAKNSVGDTPVHLACNFFSIRNITEHLINAFIEVVDILMKKGAEINSWNNYGETPLVLAARSFFSVKDVNLFLNIVTHLFRKGADCNIKNKYDRTSFREFTLKDNIEVIKLCIENGAYINDDDYFLFSEYSPLKEGILQDTNTCSQVIINKFNNEDLPALYKLAIPADTLPPIDKMKIANGKKIVQDIENTVKWEIQTKGYCNVMEVSPIVLSMLSLKSIINYYNN